jgi:hypothetical protein
MSGYQVTMHGMNCWFEELGKAVAMLAAHDPSTEPHYRLSHEKLMSGFTHFCEAAEQLHRELKDEDRKRDIMVLRTKVMRMKRVVETCMSLVQQTQQQHHDAMMGGGKVSRKSTLSKKLK